MLRLASFIAVVAIVGVVSAIIVVLRERVLEHVLRLRQQASHDSLTGALNRGAFEERVESEVIRARRARAPLAIVVFDLDHFKRINDSFGHAAGDAVLRGVGDLIARSKRRSDAFGRTRRRGVRPDAPRHRHGRRRRAVRQAPLPDGQDPHRRRGADGLLRHRRGRVGTSDARTMLEDADRAMYAAKRAGRDRAVRADEIERAPAAPLLPRPSTV